MIQAMKKLLLVEDDLSLQTILNSALSQNFKCYSVKSLTAAYDICEKQVFDVAIVDRGLPDGDGLDLIEFLYDVAFQTKVIALTSKSAVIERVTGLEAGADEYLAKPFSLAELKLKVQKFADMEKLHSQEVLTIGKLQFYPETGTLIAPGKSIHLRKKEAFIFHCLARYKNQVVSRETIIAEVWSSESIYPSQTTLDVYIRRIRILLGEYHAVIQTVRGFGYSLVEAAIE